MCTSDIEIVTSDSGFDRSNCKTHRITSAVYECLNLNVQNCKFGMNYGICMLCKHSNAQQFTLRKTTWQPQVSA